MRILITLFFVLFSSLLISQEIIDSTISINILNNTTHPDEFNTSKISFKEYGENWFSLTEDLSDIGEIEPVSDEVGGEKVVSIPLFPDSTIIGGFDVLTGKPYKVSTHGMGDIICPSLVPSGWSDKYADIVIDSIKIPFLYTRVTQDLIIDTLFVDFLKHTNTYLSYTDLNGNKEYESGEFLNQLLYRMPYISNEVHPAFIFRTDTILLTRNDGDPPDSTLIRYKELDVNDYIPSGVRYGVYLRFQPGYKWTPLIDTIDNYNKFSLLAREQKKGDMPKQLWADEAGFCTYILNTSIMYSELSGLIPLFTGVYNLAAWQYEHLLISYKLTTNALSTNELEKNKNVIRLFPNPVNDILNLNINLKSSLDVRISIIDGVGNIAFSKNLGLLNKGSHVNQISVHNLKPGVYFIKVNELSKSFVVN